MMSLREVVPSACIWLVVDRQSAECFEDSCPQLIELVDNFLVIESEFQELTPRNRDARMRLRAIVDGDFLYVDGDTVFLRAPELRPFSHPISAVPDCNQEDRSGDAGHGVFIRKVLGELGWGAPSQKYNGGVLFFAEDRRTHDFCKQWHANWLTLLQRLEELKTRTDKGEQAEILAAWHVADQLAFDYTADAVPNVVSIAQNQFNVMVPTSPQLARGARILHFFSAPAQIRGTLLQHLLDHLEQTGQYDAAAVEDCRLGGHPWAPNPEAWQYMRSGHYGKAVLRKLGRLV